MQLNPKQEIALSVVLAGKTYREAAEEAGYTEDHVKQMLRPGSRYPEVYEEYQRRLSEQSDRLKEEAYCSKAELIAELKLIAAEAQDGKPIVRDGHILGYEKDLTNWIRTVIERGKLCGHYVAKSEIVMQEGYDVDPDDLDDDEFEVYAAYEELKLKLKTKAAEASLGGGAETPEGAPET